MFSVQGDTVLDPFLGTGTTILGAIASARNSIGYEIDENFKELIEKRIGIMKEIASTYINERIRKHKIFMEKNKTKKGYWNKNYNFPVMTAQEKNILFPKIKEIKKIEENLFEVEYLF